MGFNLDGLHRDIEAFADSRAISEALGSLDKCVEMPSKLRSGLYYATYVLVPPAI